MTDAIDMSLDDIIKQNRTSRSRGRGGNVRGRGEVRGSLRGRGRGRVGRAGRGGQGGLRSRSQSRSRSRGPNTRSQSGGRSQPRGRLQSRGRFQSRGRLQTRGRSQSITQSQGRSQSRSRSRSRARSRSNSRARSVSRQFRGITPKGRAGLATQLFGMPLLTRSNRGGIQTRLRRVNSNSNLQGNVHSRLGVNTRRGALNNRPLAFVKNGIVKRGRGFNTRNRYSSVGLRSDRILQQQKQNMLRNNNVIESQTFTRSRNNSFSSGNLSRANSFGSGPQLTVSVANDFLRKRRNSFGGTNYLNKQSLSQLNNELGGFNGRRGPGSVKSMNSNKSNGSRRSIRSRGRGRGRGGSNRGVGKKFLNKQVLNPRLQKEIAAIQGKTEETLRSEKPAGVELNFTPTPSATIQTLHQRFAHA